MQFLDPELTTDLDDAELCASARRTVQEESEELRCERHEARCDMRIELLRYAS